MNSNLTKKIVINGLMIALVFLATYFTHIPTPLPGGYFNLGDAVIMAAALTLGARSGLIAGSIGSFLADIAFGGFLFAPITFFVKGIEGYIVGKIGHSKNPNEKSYSVKIVSVLTGAIIMVGGYFIAEAYILGFFDKGFGLAAAVTELTPNILQGSLSAVVGYSISEILIRAKVLNKFAG